MILSSQFVVWVWDTELLKWAGEGINMIQRENQQFLWPCRFIDVECAGCLITSPSQALKHYPYIIPWDSVPSGTPFAIVRDPHGAFHRIEGTLLYPRMNAPLYDTLEIK